MQLPFQDIVRSDTDNLDVELAASGFDNTARSEFEREIGQEGWHRLRDGEDSDEGSNHDEGNASDKRRNRDDAANGSDAPCSSAVDNETEEVDAVEDGPTAAEVASDRLLAERRKMARKAAMAQASRNAAKDKRHNSRRSVSSSMSFGW